MQKEGKPVRLLILKARQLGISTFSTAYTYHRCATNFYNKAMIIAHDLDSSNNLFGMCKRYYDFSPDMIKPMRKYSNQKVLSFANPDTRDTSNPGLLSEIILDTANNTSAGRSTTLQHVVCSEYAFWSNADTVTSALFQTIPFKPETSIIIESTTNGISGNGKAFYDRWQTEVQKGKYSTFIRVFFPYYYNPDYMLDVPSSFKLNDEEKAMYAKYKDKGMKLGHLVWRRFKIANDMGGSLLSPEDQFRQEYPCCPEEAFILSGKPVFNPEDILKDIERVNSIEVKRYEV